MVRFFLVTMFLVSSAFADNVELKINGEQYYCSKDSQGTSGGCVNQAKKIENKYNACPKPYESSKKECFSDIIPVVEANKDCAEVLAICYKLCPKPYESSKKECYNLCYN